MNKVRLAFFAALVLTASVALADKPSVGIIDFTNDTSAGWWHGSTGRDLSGMLSNEMSSGGKFKIVERSKLDAVLAEQDLASSGRVKKSTAAKAGKLTGAKYLVTGTVSAYEEKTQGTGGGISFRGISVGGKHEEAYIAIDVRVIDTTSGEVKFSRTVEARSTSNAVSGGLYRGGFGGDLATYNNTPAGKAIRACLVEISDYLGCVMVDQDSCVQEYQQKEDARRAKTKGTVKLE
jgi:curli biogenesis system outer membrane secretion channel CsgG